MVTIDFLMMSGESIKEWLSNWPALSKAIRSDGL